MDADFRDLARQSLASADEERHASPTPVVYLELNRHVSLSDGTAGDLGLLTVSGNWFPRNLAGPVLTAHRSLGNFVDGHRPDGAKDLDLLLAHRIGVEGDGRFHGRQCQKLK